MHSASHKSNPIRHQPANQSERGRARFGRSGILPTLLAALGLLTTISQACYYDNKEDLFPDTTSCQTDSMSFSQHIVPILNTYCISCHNNASAQAGISLEGYSNVINFVNDGRLLKTIKHEPGVVPMPLNQDKMPECPIQRIDAWIQQGAPDN